jgi:(p)ppGpp synthase/HD superfamily hydrolase
MSVRHRLSERAPSVLLVSVADKLHNIRALLRDYRAVEEAFWIRFNPEAGRAGTLGYYRGLATAYSRRLEQVQDARVRVLVETFKREVDALEDLVGAKGQWPLTDP